MKNQNIRTILCPIDFDVNSLAALDRARDLTRENDGMLHVLHVVIPPDPLLISAPYLAQRAADYARIRLEEIARESLANTNYRLHLKIGRPAEEITNTAAAIEADLVVMATHGYTGVSRFFLGSVAEKVVRESSCPVLTIRGRSASYERESSPAEVLS